MTPLPGALGGRELIAWRVDRAAYAPGWDSGAGAAITGGRWNSKGVSTVYCSIDPATAIIELGANLGFNELNKVPHVLTSFEIADPSSVHIVDITGVPNPNWLIPGAHSAGQRQFGDTLVAKYKFVVIPSTVSTRSWNLIFVATVAAGAYIMRSQKALALDPKLDPPAP